MKKNRTVLLIIITLISIFSFNTKVSAATELTCVYAKGTLDPKRVIVQHSNGQIDYYTNTKDKKISEDGWVYQTSVNVVNKISNKEQGDYYNSDGTLKKCPGAINGDAKKLKLYAGVALARESLLKESMSGKAVKPGSTEAKKAVKEKEQNEQKEKQEKEKAKAEQEKTINDLKGKTCAQINFSNAWLNNQSTLSCLYAATVDNLCYIVQLNLDKDKKPTLYNNIATLADASVVNKIDDVNEVISAYGGTCPITLYLEKTAGESRQQGTKAEYTIRMSNDDRLLGDSTKMPLKYAKGKNLVTGENIEGSKVNIDFAFEKTSVKTCSDLFSGTSGDKLKEMLINFRIIIQVLIPVLLIGLGIVDFAKAVLSESEDNMKKIQNKFIKRLIIGIAFFLIPTLLRVILGIASKIWPVISADLCGII